MKRLSQILDKCAVAFVSHNAADIQQVCDQIIWLENGRSKFNGVTDQGLKQYAAASKIEVESSSNLLAPITSATVIPLSKIIKIGETLEIRITVISSKSVEINYFVGAIVAETGETVAQFHPPWKNLMLSEGENIICIKIKSLCLTPGVYTINVLGCGSGGKSLYFHLSQHGRFESKGGGFLWAAYQPETMR
jgi:ABC-type sulfate/molybdate transport systems ATPase subunit